MTRQKDPWTLIRCWRCGHERYFDPSSLSSKEAHYCEACGALLVNALLPQLGDLLADHLLPLGLGFLVAVLYVLTGGEPVSLLAGPAIAWCAWQFSRWWERQR